MLPFKKEMNFLNFTVFAPKILDPGGVTQYNFGPYMSGPNLTSSLLRKILWKRFV